MKKTYTACALGLTLAFCCTGTASATVTGSGTFQLTNIPTNATLKYGYWDKNFAYIGESSPTGPIGNTYYLDSNYTGSATYNSTTLQGNYNQTDGSMAFSYSATAGTYDANAQSVARIDLFSELRFTGVLSNYGYDYTFNTSLDSDRDMPLSVIQTEIYFDDTSGTKKAVYSDYGDYYLVDPSTLRTKMVKILGEGSFSGSLTFDYSSYGTQDWHIKTDFQGYGKDVYQNVAAPAPVPEPATMLLFGTGIIGLVGSRVRRKKK